MFQIRENQTVYANSIGKGKGAFVSLSDRRAFVRFAIRKRVAESPGHARLSGGAVFWIIHARNKKNHERSAQQRRTI